MNIFLVLLTLIFIALLMLVTAHRPTPSVFSRFELKRRSKHTPSAQAELDKQERLNDLQTIQFIKMTILLVTVTCLSIVTFGWAIGIIGAIVVAVFLGPVARLPVVVRVSHWLYATIDPWWTKAVITLQPALRILHTATIPDTEEYRRFDSREELQHLIEKSGAALSSHERLLLSHALNFHEKVVSSVMTPRNVIVSVKKGEFLGPLVLSELHDSGHSRLPVIDEDLDHVVGTLHLRDLLSLDIKRSSTVERAMEPKVFYIHENDTLEHALGAFLETHHHLFIVINEQRETVGLLSLEDVIEALIGRKIIDEDDNHADLRAVAVEKGRTNNRSEGHVDL